MARLIRPRAVGIFNNHILDAGQCRSGSRFDSCCYTTFIIVANYIESRGSAHSMAAGTDLNDCAGRANRHAGRHDTIEPFGQLGC